MNFSERLNSLIKDRNFSIKALAHETGIPRTTLSEWLSGRKPQLGEDIVKLASFLGVSIEFLITGKEIEKEFIQDLINGDDDDFIQVHKGVYRITIEKKQASTTHKKGEKQ